MRRVVRALSEPEASVCEVLVLSGGCGPSLADGRLRALEALLTLVAVHHLVLRLQGGVGWALLESCALRHLLFAGRRRKVAAGHARHRVIVSHRNLPVVLVVFPIDTYS